MHDIQCVSQMKIYVWAIYALSAVVVSGSDDIFQPLPRLSFDPVEEGMPFAKDEDLERRDRRLTDDQIYKRTLACFIHSRDFVAATIHDLKRIAIEKDSNAAQEFNDNFAGAIMTQMSVAHCSTTMQSDKIDYFLNSTSLTEKEAHELFTFPNDYTPKMSSKTVKAIRKVSDDARAKANAWHLPELSNGMIFGILGSLVTVYGLFVYRRHKKKNDPLGTMSEKEMEHLVKKYEKRERKRKLERREQKKLLRAAKERGEIEISDISDDSEIDPETDPSESFSDISSLSNTDDEDDFDSENDELDEDEEIDPSVIQEKIKSMIKGASTTEKKIIEDMSGNILRKRTKSL